MSQQSQKSQNFVFVNSTDPVMQNKVIHDEPLIKLPFPPTINPRDLITFPKGSNTPSRAPNAFIIYRKLFIQTAKEKGYSLPMTVISTMASRSWEQETEIVKSEYKRIAKDAFDYRNEILPKKKREGKKKPWNIISFKQSDKPKSNEKTDHVQKIFTPMTSPEFSSDSPNLDFDPFIYPSPTVDNNSLTPIQSREINDNITENRFLNDYITPESTITTENQYGLGISDFDNFNIINTPDSSNHQFTDLSSTELLPEELNTNNTISFDDFCSS
ncbi:10040_t:CDS:2 [Diversispora eburnea]|uniref:10040_t:CDS:1 n=1 Tax=Diversispora eburnea TaxID=1213867 RepID=A0A9N9CTR2_9GLOM|nr:10040_t:CDS:2 [Diversispora eburnea]